MIPFPSASLLPPTAPNLQPLPIHFSPLFPQMAETPRPFLCFLSVVPRRAMGSLVSCFHLHRVLVFVTFLLLFRPSRSQQGTPPDVSATTASASDCNGDLSQISVQISIGGTFFGSPPPAVSLPSSVSSLVVPSNTSTSIATCCLPNPDFKPNTTSNSSDADGSDSFLPRRSGDLTISYDVVQAFASSYSSSLKPN